MHAVDYFDPHDEVFDMKSASLICIAQSLQYT